MTTTNHKFLYDLHFSVLHFCLNAMLVFCLLIVLKLRQSFQCTLLPAYFFGQGLLGVGTLLVQGN